MGPVRVAWGGISPGATIDATTGNIFLPARGGLYSALSLLPAPGSNITFQLPADLSLVTNFKFGFQYTQTLGGFDDTWIFIAAGGNLYISGAPGPVVATPNMYLRIEIAPNAKDFLTQTSLDNINYTTIFTRIDYAGYYVNDGGRAMFIRALADSDINVTCGPIIASKLVNGLQGIAFDGNSLTAGTNSTTGAQNTGETGFLTAMGYPSQLIRLLPRNWYQTGNFGISGQTSVQMSANAATNVDVRINRYNGKILIAWEITNSFCNSPATKEQAYDDFVAYCVARRAVGWRVIALNVINRTTNLGTRTAAEFTAAQTYWNTRMASDFATYAEVMVDVNALNLQNTVGWDGTHPSDAGYALVAAALKPVIAPFLV